MFSIIYQLLNKKPKKLATIYRVCTDLNSCFRKDSVVSIYLRLKIGENNTTEECRLLCMEAGCFFAFAASVLAQQYTLVHNLTSK